jgi:hypothetical protein
MKTIILFLLVLCYINAQSTWYPVYNDRSINGTLTIRSKDLVTLSFRELLNNGSSNPNDIENTIIFDSGPNGDILDGLLFGVGGSTTSQYTTDANGYATITIYGNTTYEETYEIVAVNEAEGRVSLYNITVLPTDCGFVRNSDGYQHSTWFVAGFIVLGAFLLAFIIIALFSMWDNTKEKK